MVSVNVAVPVVCFAIKVACLLYAAPVSGVCHSTEGTQLQLHCQIRFVSRCVISWVVIWPVKSAAITVFLACRGSLLSGTLSLFQEECLLEAGRQGSSHNHCSVPDLSWQHGGSMLSLVRNAVILKTDVRHATKLSNFMLGDEVACLTSQVAQLLMSRATNLLDRNHLCSSAISRSVAEL